MKLWGLRYDNDHDRNDDDDIHEDDDPSSRRRRQQKIKVDLLH